MDDSDLDFFPFGAPSPPASAADLRISPPGARDVLMDRFDRACARDAALRARGRVPPKPKARR